MLPRALWDYRNAMKNHRLSSEELLQLQNKKTRAIINYAYYNIPFYHARVKATGKSPSDFQTVSDLKYIPLLTKGELSEQIGGAMVNPKVKVGHFAGTSGTTGKRLFVPYDKRFCDIVIANRARKLKFSGGDLFDRFAYVTNVAASPEERMIQMNQRNKFA